MKESVQFTLSNIRDHFLKGEILDPDTVKTLVGDEGFGFDGYEAEQYDIVMSHIIDHACKNTREHEENLVAKRISDHMDAFPDYSISHCLSRMFKGVVEKACLVRNEDVTPERLETVKRVLEVSQEMSDAGMFPQEYINSALGRVEMGRLYDHAELPDIDHFLNLLSEGSRLNICSKLNPIRLGVLDTRNDDERRVIKRLSDIQIQWAKANRFFFPGDHAAQDSACQI